MERIASGYQLAEAPVAGPDGGVFFSDALGGGVHHWSPATGVVENVIPKRRGEVPASFVSSLCFGGADGRDLFITTLAGADGDGGVFLTRSPVAGAPIEPVRAP